MSWILKSPTSTTNPAPQPPTNTPSTSTPSETDPLMGAPSSHQHHRQTSAGQYYFARDPVSQGGTFESLQDADGGAEHETLPTGTKEQEFAPRLLQPPPPTTTTTTKTSTTTTLTSTDRNHGTSSGWWSGWWWSHSGSSSTGTATPTPLSVKLRKAPIKVEPKVFFANERTFLAWLHVSIMLAGASIAILAFTGDSNYSNPWSQLYGLVLLPVAMAFILYAMYQYARRAYMLRNRHPGPYEDTVGPTVLAIMLMLSIVAQFAIKLYSLRAL